MGSRNSSYSELDTLGFGPQLAFNSIIVVLQCTFMAYTLGKVRTELARKDQLKVLQAAWIPTIETSMKMAIPIQSV